MNTRSIVIFIISIVALFSFAETAFAGFGITPPYVRNNVLRPGSEFTQEIIIVRSDPLEDLNAEIEVNVLGIQQWFSIDKGMKFILPKGEKQVRMNVTVRVPEEASLGPRVGNLRIRTYGNDLPTGGVSLALGAQIDVSLDVVEQIFDFEVRRVELADVEEGRHKWWLDFPGKIRLLMHIENTGNVPNAPPKVTFDIYDTTGARLLESTQNTNTIEPILPFLTKKVEAVAPTRLNPGSYRVKYKIYKNADIVAQTGELALSILPKGTIPGYTAYGFFGLSLGDQLSLVLPALFVLILLVWFFFFRKTKTRTKRKVRREEPKEEEYEEDDRDEPPQVTRRTQPRAQNGGVVDLSRRRT